MELEKFIQWHEDQLRRSTPYLIYSGQSDYLKTRFGVIALHPHGVKQKLGRKKSKELLKNTSLKFKPGQRFVIRSSDNRNEVIPGYGIVAGNIAGKDWTVEDVEFLLSQDIEGIRWIDSDNNMISYPPVRGRD